jgi:hypothetical protein
MMAAFVHGGPKRFKHQMAGLAKLIKTGGVTALLFDPGTGKTAVAVDYACLLALKAGRGEARVLVVCPSAAADTWVLQFRKFASPQVGWWAGVPDGSVKQRVATLAWLGGQPFKGARRPGRMAFCDSSHPSGGLALPGDVEGPRVVLAVLGIEAAQSRAEVGSRTMADVILDGVKRFSPDLVIVDESHRIKGAGSNSSRLMARVGDTVKRRMILTGTVEPHSPMDVFAQWRFLQPYAFGPITGAGAAKKATLTGFEGRYAVKGGFMGHEIKAYVNLDEMAAIMARNAVVAKKDDVLDLPPVTDTIVPVTMQPAEQKAYDDLMASFVTVLDSGHVSTADGFLAQLMKLRQVTSGFVSDDQGRMHRVGDSKAQAIDSIVNDSLIGEKRIVVFCVFVAEIAYLARKLARKGTRIEVITGATPNEERAKIRADFGSGNPERIVLVCQVRTMSLAVNELVTASHAVYGSLSQLRDDFAQSRDRLNRTGQAKPVTFWYALGNRANGARTGLRTVDKVIFDSHIERTNLEDQMLRYVKEFENEASPSLTDTAKHDAMAMFRG